ncbi:MAG: glycosyltransferase family 4 protein [bacterium]|nr:glycosyltransferase family 4 protein [bacterium]
MLHFLLGFREHFDELVFIARVFPEIDAEDMPYEVPEDGVRVVALPPYPRIHNLYLQPWRYWGSIERALRATLPQLDAVWLNFGHPVSHRALALASRTPHLKPFAVLRGNYDRDAGLRAPGPAFVRRAASAVMLTQLRAFAKRARKMNVPCFTYGQQLVDRLREFGLEAIPLIDSVIHERVLEQEVSPHPNYAADLLVVSRLAPEKGVDVLLRALPKIEVDGRPAILRIVGSGESEAELRQLASQLGLEQRVIFDGHVSVGEELFARYASARLLVIPSHTEGVPKTAFEAMAFGRPVLATAVGGLPEILGEEEDRGRLIPAGDPALMAHAANELLADPERLERMGTSARSFAREITLERQVCKIVAAARLDSQD